MAKRELPTQFGLFYPNGYIVAAFLKREDALRVQQDLVTGGYDPQDCPTVESDEVATKAKRQLDDADWLAGLGKSDEMIQKHIGAAEQGATFVLAYAPDDLDAERAMNVIRRVPFELAHRYHRFGIQVMK